MPNAPLAPAGPLATAVSALQTLIAGVPFFQTWTGTNATTALARIWTGEVGYPITSAAIAGGVCTLATREPHMLTPGQVIMIEGAALGEQGECPIDGQQTIIATPAANTFTIAAELPDLATVYPDQSFIIPSPRPLAVICEDKTPTRATIIGTSGTACYAGSIEILLEADVTPAYQFDAYNAVYEARNSWGQFLQGLAETQGTGDLMLLNKIEPLSGPDFTSKAEQDSNAPRFERWRAKLRVEWGLES